MDVGGDRFAFLQVGGSEPVDRQHDEGRTDEAERNNDKNPPVLIFYINFKALKLLQCDKKNIIHLEVNTISK